MADAKTLLLEGDQIHRLRDFLAKIETVELDGEFGVRFSAEASEQLLEGRRLPAGLLAGRVTEVVEFLQSNVTAPEVTALARRREKLGEFRRMLSEDLPEPIWQAWLEAEPWILGFAVAPQYLHKVGKGPSLNYLRGLRAGDELAAPLGEELGGGQVLLRRLPPSQEGCT